LREQFQAIYASTEALIYDIERVITKIDIGAGNFTHIRRRACMTELGNINADMFVDACILSGASAIPPLPMLLTQARAKQPRIKSAVEMMMARSASGFALCQQLSDEPQMRRDHYLDLFRLNRLAVKHDVYITREGQILPLDLEHAPSDMHEVITQRLPDELLYYFSKGLVSHELLNWRVLKEINELPPIDGGDSEEYRHLVKDQLTPIRACALRLLSDSLHRAWGHQDIYLKLWYEPNNKEPIGIRDVEDPKTVVMHWNVKEAAIKEQMASHAYPTTGKLAFTVTSLRNSDFAASTVTKADKMARNVLTTKTEVLSNSIWRFLELRRYVDSQHRLTKWGTVLATMLDALGAKPELEDGVFIAVELARLGLLNGKDMFPQYSGGPGRFSDTEQRNVLLVSRVACLGKLHHREVGFTGPLSRHLLGYSSMISAIRGTLRDLLEASLANLLLSGDATREQVTPEYGLE
jgi:hypothetical protein